MKHFVNRASAFLLTLMVLCTTLIPSDLVLADTTTETEEAATVTYTSVHDPSIVVGYIDGTASDYTGATTVYGEQNDEGTRTKMYFIFGSHRAWSYSFDLMNWTSFTNNINTDYNTIFAEDAEWSALGGSQDSASGNYEVVGNLWAPDVVWNPTYVNSDGTTGAWCMYMSVNGDYWYTSVVLLTADSLNGDWTRVGPVVYSGFANADQAAKTDYFKVQDTDGNSLEWDDRYIEKSNGGQLLYGMNAIDPCVFFDDGALWMTYGSWFGGIYMIKLDPATGYRDYTATYALTDNESDPYMGYKIAGGRGASGEASYIEKIGNYYYLFMSYGGFVADGGYNMRIFRSESVTGPYVDESGDDARYTTAVGNTNINKSIGMRLMSYYKWNYMNYGYTAQGHNSQFVDDDGKAYVIYHTRTNDGSEGHSVRVHQLFVTENGWLAAAPFEYTGESLTPDITAEDVEGSYEVLFHEGTNYADLECIGGRTYGFTADGVVKFSGAETGTWEWSQSKGAPYVNVTINGVTYEGVFVEQYMETETAAGAPIETVRGVGDKTMAFTLVGDASCETAVWGYKYVGEDADIAQNAAGSLAVPSGTFTSLSLPATCTLEVPVQWKSSDPTILGDDGVLVNQPEEDTTVTLTATITYNECTVSCDYDVIVYSPQNNEENKVLARYFTDEQVDLTDAKKGDYCYDNPFYFGNTFGLNTSNGVSVKFDVKWDGKLDTWLSNIIAFNGGEKGGLYFTGNSYLGYNASGSYIDANIKNGDWGTFGWGTNFINKETMATVEIQILPTGFCIYVDGMKAFDQNDIETYNAGQTSYTIPGGYSEGFEYSSLLNYLITSATQLNVGWGSWWDGGYKGTISNLELAVLPVEVKDTSAYNYYEDFSGYVGASGTAGTGWTSPNIESESDLSVKYDADNADIGYYLQYANSRLGASRAAYTTLPENCQYALSDTAYTVETDIRISSGTDRESQFVITGKDCAYSGNAINNGVDSGYILKISVAAASTTATVNDDSSLTMSLDKDTWYHVTAAVNQDGTVYAKIGNTIFETTVNGEGTLNSIYLNSARSTGTAPVCVDNIAVKDVFSCIHDSDTWVEGETREATCFEDGGVIAVCPTCGYETVVGEVVPALGHDYQGVVTEPTCVDQGYTTYTCSRCQEFYVSDYVSATGHQNTEIRNAKAADCLNDGYSGDTYCLDCETLVESGTTLKALGHDYVGVVTEPTCVDQGYTTYICSRCQDSYVDDYTDPTGIHNYEPDAGKGTATCTEGGSIYEYCTVCGDEKITPDGEPLGHHWVENQILKEATCAEEGIMQYICDRECCSGEAVTKTEPIAKTDIHIPGNAVQENRKEATCGTAGSYEEVIYCSVCGEELSRETKALPATGIHTPGNAVQENRKEATCGTSGSYEEVIYCSVCGEEISRETKALPKTAHTYVATVIEKTCVQDGYTLHTCSVCGDSYKSDEEKAIGHIYVDTVVEPTCAEGGYTVHSCSNCDESYVDTYTKPTGNHDYEGEITTPATCTENGIKTFTCSVCKDTYVIAVEAKGHDYDEGVVTKAPTTTETGEITYTCRNCGDHYVKAVDKLPADKTPDIGTETTVTPAKVSVSKVQNTAKGVSITWTKAANAQGYYIYRKEGNGAYKQIAAITNAATLKYVDAKAKNGAVYTYQVIAYNGKAAGKAGTVKKIVYLTTVKLTSVKAKASRKAAVKYKKNSKAAGYQIQYSTKSSFKGAKTVKVKSAKKLSTTLKKLAKGKKYYVRIRTYKKSGKTTFYSVWSAKKTVKIQKY